MTFIIVDYVLDPVQRSVKLDFVTFVLPYNFRIIVLQIFGLIHQLFSLYLLTVVLRFFFSNFLKEFYCALFYPESGPQGLPVLATKEQRQEWENIYDRTYITPVLKVCYSVEPLHYYTLYSSLLLKTLNQEYWLVQWHRSPMCDWF